MVNKIKYPQMQQWLSSKPSCWLHFSRNSFASLTSLVFHLLQNRIIMFSNISSDSLKLMALKNIIIILTRVSAIILFDLTLAFLNIIFIRWLELKVWYIKLCTIWNKMVILPQLLLTGMSLQSLQMYKMKKKYATVGWIKPTLGSEAGGSYNTHLFNCLQTSLLSRWWMLI